MSESGPKDAIATYLEQTKLLAGLSSAFVVAPPAAVALLSSDGVFWLFIVSEALFVGSVLMGYVVFATIAGYQHKNRYDVHRPSTRFFSVMQIGLFLAGLIMFAWMCAEMIDPNAAGGASVSNPLAAKEAA